MIFSLKKKTFLVVLILILSVSLFSQESKKNYRVGFGIETTTLTNVISGGLPSLRVPIDIGNSVKIEPQISYYQSENKEWEEKETQMSFGVGGFYKTNKNDLSIYYGGVLGYKKYETEDTGDGEDITSEEDGIYIEPKIGGEYNIISNFSIGGEVGIQYFNNKISDTGTTEDYNNKRMLLRSKIIFRFYF